MKNEIKVVSPWVNYYREIESMFKKDSDVTVVYKGNVDPYTLKIYVCGQDKYDALSQLIPAEKSFGNITLHIDIIPDNKLKMSKVDLFRRAFSGNPVVTDIITVGQEAIGSTNDFNYIVFEKEVVQYHDDSLGDPHGNRSTLYQELAKDIFGEHDGIYFCTESRNLNKPVNIK